MTVICILLIPKERKSGTGGNESILSPKRLSRLTYKDNGNLVVEKREDASDRWDDVEVKWSTNTGDLKAPPGQAMMNSQGQLILVNGNGEKYWESRDNLPASSKYSKLVLGETGRLETVTMTKETTWSNFN